MSLMQSITNRMIRYNHEGKKRYMCLSLTFTWILNGEWNVGNFTLLLGNTFEVVVYNVFYIGIVDP